MAMSAVRTTKVTIYDDGISMSEYDGNIADMLDRDLYTRDWTLVGTNSPVDDDTGYFDMKFVQNNIQEADDANKVSKLKIDPNSPIPFYHTDDVLFEQIPIDKRVLGPYYDYFSKYVSRGLKGDLLLNICKDVYKSPVFDIQYCAIVRPSNENYNHSSFVTFDTGDGPGVIFIPMMTTDVITDGLDDIGIRVMPSPQDTWSYSSCRVRMSEYAVTCVFASSDWKGNAYVAEFSRRLQCTAVATATLTVSVLLEPWQHSRGRHTSKYCMTYVVHAIK